MKLHTSHVRDTQYSGLALLQHATLVWVEGASSWNWTADRRTAIRKEGLRVCAGLRRWLLHSWSVWLELSEHLRTYSHMFGVSGVRKQVRGFRADDNRAVSTTRGLIPLVLRNDALK